jgi:biopolymer transport protein ExbD
MATLSVLGLPERRRRYGFALTPLADAMFQLLIFFMLSSGLTPYSLLKLQSADGDTTIETTAVPDVNASDVLPDAGQVETALWTIEAEAVIVGGQRFGFEALDELAKSLGVAGTPADVLLIIRSSAQVQDVSTVLARLSAANVGSVQITTGAF